MPRSPPVPPKHDDQTNRQLPKRDRLAHLVAPMRKRFLTSCVKHGGISNFRTSWS